MNDNEFDLYNFFNKNLSKKAKSSLFKKKDKTEIQAKWDSALNSYVIPYAHDVLEKAPTLIDILESDKNKELSLFDNTQSLDVYSFLTHILYDKEHGAKLFLLIMQYPDFYIKREFYLGKKVPENTEIELFYENILQTLEKQNIKLDDLDDNRKNTIKLVENIIKFNNYFVHNIYPEKIEEDEDIVFKNIVDCDYMSKPMVLAAEKWCMNQKNYIGASKFLDVLAAKSKKDIKDIKNNKPFDISFRFIP